ncbi:MAG: amidohydrolase family protein [Candidatus Thorarchaeota archaeon]|nr:amidohydrolase family protein [Candidatus Thorarchaeota archaeon]
MVRSTRKGHEMASIVVKNGLVVTCNKRERMVEGGYVRVDGNRIVDIGEGDPSEPSDQVIDASGGVIVPGLITAHTHLYGILLRGANLGISPPGDFAQVLQRVWWPVDEALRVEDAYASALAASAQMLLSGSTFFADTYSGPNSIRGSLDAIARASSETGMRAMIAFEVTERNSEEEARIGLEEARRFAARADAKDGLISLMTSIHASFTVSDGLIETAVSQAAELGLPLTIHTSEGLVDLYHNLERYGERTVERLERLGALGPRTVLAHCVHVDDHELDLIASSGASVAHNPMSNMLNAVGTAPVPAMLRRGIPVGLGNDGWVFDPFENMRCALTVHRLASGSPSAIGPDEVWKMATTGGARCYGLQDRLGSLEVGHLADMVVLDASRVPTPLTSSSVVGHLVNTFSARDVAHVIVNGRVVVSKGHLVLADESRIVQISRQSARDLWNRVGSKMH